MPVQAPGPEVRVYRPAELNREVRLHLEAGFPRLWLSGEISNFSRPASGHWYFTLKDDRAQIRCALFRSQAREVGFQPANGLEVLVRGRLSLYEPRGDYQLIAEAMLEAGAGALQQAFEALKKKLEAEGLFAAERKKPLPRYPARIAVVTSPTGAAVRDIVKTLRLRWPAAKVRIYPAQVQGEAAPASLIRALEAADAHGFAEVILLARGGGSLEDLWAFNDQTLARCILGLKTPVVSGVGHETDFTIADFVADHRAATPTAAAQAATPDGPELAANLRRLDRRLNMAIQGRLGQWQQQTDFLDRRLSRLHPSRRLAELAGQRAELHRRLQRLILQQLDRRRDRLAGLNARLAAHHPGRRLERARETLRDRRLRLTRAISLRLERAGQRLAETARALHAVSPLAVLGRGYGLVQDPAGTVLTRREQFRAEDPIRIRMRDFRIDAEVRGTATEPWPEDVEPGN